MDKTKKILVTRFSALGDVAMTIPIIKLFLAQNQAVEVVFVSRQNVSSLFEGIERLTFIPIDLERKHKGILGLYKFYNELKKEKITAYVDLHNVLRTHLLRFLFSLNGITVKKIDKGRNEKKALTRKTNKNKSQLKSTFDRYAAVFRSMEYPLTLPQNSFFEIKKQSNKIGIAPFAQHQGKIYPLEKTKEIALYFAKKKYTVLLFGGGNDEKSILESWSKLHQNISVVSAKSLAAEVEIMKDLSFMFSMDSANMHLASLAETAVFSFWGATHWYSGFLGYRQNPKFIIQEKLDCCPCSVYGNKACFRGDYACLHSFNPSDVIKKIEDFIEK